MRLRLILAFCLVSTLAGCVPDDGARENVELTTQQCPLCTAEQISRHDERGADSLGIAAEDRLGATIGGWPNERGIDPPFYEDLDADADDNIWRPLSPVKQTACGTLHHFNYYDGYEDEADFNSYIVPAASHSWVVEGLEAHDCDGEACFNAEITPDQAWIAHNEWFDVSTVWIAPPLIYDKGRSALEGSYVCVYGPWVTDFGHEEKPTEIHPAHLMWWRTGDEAFLLALQDDSQRFGSAEDVDFDEPGLPQGQPSWWRPWSAPRSRHLFEVAFDLSPAPAFGTATIDVAVDIHKGVIPNARDTDDGASHSLIYNGETLLTVEESPGTDENVQVYFTDVCRLESGRLLGYVTLDTTLDTGSDEAGEAFQMLRLAQSGRTFPSIEPFPPPDLTVKPKVLEGTLEAGGGGSEPSLTGNVALELWAGPAASKDDVTVAAVDHVLDGQRRTLPFTQLSPSRVLVEGVTLSRGGELVLTTRSGLETASTVPEYVLVPQLRDESPQQLGETLPQPEAIPQIADPASRLPASIDLAAVPAWQAQAAPLYVPLIDGELHLEDASKVTQELNEAIAEQEPAEMMQLFGSVSPFTTSWSFTARNLITGEVIDVGTSAGSEAEEPAVDIRSVDGPVADSLLEVSFPPSSPDVYELTATATIRDPLGTAVREVRQSIWSHALVDEPAALVDQLLSLASTLPEAGDDLAEESRLRPDESYLRRLALRPRARSAVIIRVLASDAANDGVVTIGELEGLMDAARALAAVPLR